MSFTESIAQRKIRVKREYAEQERISQTPEIRGVFSTIIESRGHEEFQNILLRIQKLSIC